MMILQMNANKMIHCCYVPTFVVVAADNEGEMIQEQCLLVK